MPAKQQVCVSQMLGEYRCKVNLPSPPAKSRGVSGGRRDIKKAGEGVLLPPLPSQKVSTEGKKLRLDVTNEFVQKKILQ